MSEDPDKLQRAGKEALGDPTEEDPGRPSTEDGVDAAAPRSAKESDDGEDGNERSRVR
jgi:hypothetical protein